MRDDRRDNSIVSGPEKWRWPWSGARDVDIGSASRIENSTVNLGVGARAENSTVDNAGPSGVTRFKTGIPRPLRSTPSSAVATEV